MTLTDFLAGNLSEGLNFLKGTTADLTDAELLMRPVPGANHANWQIGHLIIAETHILGAAGASMPELPAGFAERYKKDTAGIDDASKFATKAELLALFEKTRAGSVAFAKTMTPEKLAAKGPMPFTPTVADALSMMNVHVAMHVGQMQVLRRKLGKPILF